MSSRVWKFISNTIGKLQSPRPSQQNGNLAESSSLRETDSLSSTPTRHGSVNKLGEQLAESGLSSAQDESILETPSEKISNIREKLEEAVKPVPKIEAQDDVQEDVTASNTGDDDLETALKTTAKSPVDESFSILPPRQNRSKRKDPAEKVEPLAHNEVLVENTRKTRARGKAAKDEKTTIHDEAPSSPGNEGLDEVVGENSSELAEPVVKNELPEIFGSEGDLMAEVAELSVRDEDPVEVPQTNRSNRKRPILPRVAEPVQTSTPSIDTPPVSNNKRRRDVLESSTGNEGLELDSSADVPTKRRKLAPKPEGMGIPPVGTTPEARDERRKYMDRERQRRCRQRKKERQQGMQEAEREVLAQAKDERKKAMARERVRRYRENQRQKQGGEMESKTSGRQRTREQARQRDMVLISSGRNDSRNSGGSESFDSE
ncbi:4a5f6166-53ac-4ef2-b186-650af8a723a0 [Sclerotinia trifoliorum]|uniref:4a5f6166-53ac-4ef2-b186-650af8a723a0 n=1 Tax=Sclerotinia trifoliorum TaxID=28548 RepID=A0A8H2ZKD7_9HELO|nr:4a5f6166-53ac-4ef2-b186-650af8a723a0 [Sclerotinia trifoliorum]